MSTEAAARRRRFFLGTVREEILWRAILVIGAAIVLAALQATGFFDRVLALLH